MTDPSRQGAEVPGGRFGITFQPTVSLGGIVHLVVIVGAVIGAWAELRAQLATVTDKMITIERRLEAAISRNEYELTVGVINTRLNMMSDRVDRLSERPRLGQPQ